MKIVIGVLGLACVIAPVAVAGQVIDTVLFEQGQQLYQDNCAVCHMDSGAGNPPTFPALSGNDRLGDPVRIVTHIHQGEGTMPPFPGLRVGEISSLTNYVRGAWASDSPRCDHRRSGSGGWKGLGTLARSHRSGKAYSPTPRRNGARRCIRAPVAPVTAVD